MLPGDKSKKNLLASILRVNHAGEFGAKRIYQGQLDHTKDSKAKALIEHMQQQEEVHLEYFAAEITKRKVRPSALLPIWNIYGYLLGAATARMGNKSAMACTEAIEEVINDHYLEQLAKLDDNEKELKEKIEAFRQEELEHRDIALQQDSTGAKGHKLLTWLIKASCKLAIRASKIL